MTTSSPREQRRRAPCAHRRASSGRPIAACVETECDLHRLDGQEGCMPSGTSLRRSAIAPTSIASVSAKVRYAGQAVEVLQQFDVEPVPRRLHDLPRGDPTRGETPTTMVIATTSAGGVGEDPASQAGTARSRGPFRRYIAPGTRRARPAQGDARSGTDDEGIQVGPDGDAADNGLEAPTPSPSATTARREEVAALSTHPPQSAGT
jgi:hypothetical protein